jgi:ketosteroid isomerase-like protein
MADDIQAIRDLITRWAEAVHAGDLGALLADHAPPTNSATIPTTGYD